MSNQIRKCSLTHPITFRKLALVCCKIPLTLEPQYSENEHVGFMATCPKCGSRWYVERLYKLERPVISKSIKNMEITHEYT